MGSVAGLILRKRSFPKGLEPHIRMSAQKMSVIQKLGDTQQGKLASEQFAHPGLRNIKQFLQLPGGEPLLLDKPKDVLMQVRLQFQLQTLLFAHIQLIKNASPCAVGDQLAWF